MTVKSKKALSIGMLVAAGIVWGATFVVVKDSMDYISPLWQLALRLLIACMLMLAIFHRRLAQIKRQAVIQGVFLGVLFFLALLFQNLGCKETTASKCSFLTVSYVAFVPILEMLILKKRLTGRKLLSVVICLSGMALLTLNGNFSVEKGDLLVILCGLLYAFHILYIDHCSTTMDAMDMHLMQIITATVLAFGAAIIFEPIPVVTNVHCWMGLIYCGIFEVVVGFFFQLKGQQNTSPTLAGILVSMESVYGSIFAAIFLRESFTLRMIAGCAAIFLAAVVEGQESPAKKEG
jgi:drug/metabolite transporter (DMT)-like permease